MCVSRTRRRRGNEESVVTPFRLGTLDKDLSAIVHEINRGQLRRRIRRDHSTDVPVHAELAGVEPIHPIPASIEHKILKDKVFGISALVGLQTVDRPAVLISLYEQIAEVKARHLLGRRVMVSDSYS